MLSAMTVTVANSCPCHCHDDSLYVVASFKMEIRYRNCRQLGTSYFAIKDGIAMACPRRSASHSADSKGHMKTSIFLQGKNNMSRRKLMR